MKTFWLIFPWVLVAVLVGYHFFNPKSIINTTISEMEIKKIQSDRDRLIRVISFKNDTLAAIRGVKESLEFQLGKANKERNQTIQNHNENVFKPIDSNTSRIRELSELYVSIRFE